MSLHHFSVQVQDPLVRHYSKLVNIYAHDALEVDSICLSRGLLVLALEVVEFDISLGQEEELPF